ncbi:CocE/NonD family hydrolase [Duganella sp. FT135W]|uniref:CocE/NonD family hydrolase n=1 Tax=Duganella flavida TaxID=2692175 RepID=A0A6L8KP05_9BURK|nr:CocE/NonD family hydrolase [Duganella flavida]MYM26281.1 CocE/NonD family hydrolase [Duganella flavida]
MSNSGSSGDASFTGFRVDVLACKVPMNVQKDVMVETRDGVRVAMDIYRPEGPGPFPTLYAVSPYNKDTIGLPPHGVFRWREAGNIGRWVEQGYAFVHADTRGTGASEGEWLACSEEEQTDMYDTIEWIAAQSWSTGKVGMIGESYYAYPQWLAAATNPPHLACIAPYDGLVDLYRDVVYHGGLCSAGFIAWWSTNTRALTLLERGDGPHPNNGGGDIVGDWLRNPTMNDFWRVRSAFDKFKDIKTPFYSIANWTAVGIHLRGNLLAYEQIDAPKKLMVAGGNNHHSPIEVYHSDEVHTELTRWYDYWLKGIDTGIMDEAPVKIWVNNEGWREEQEWPLARVEYKSLYLSSAKAGAVNSLNDGSLSWEAPASDDATRLDYPHKEWGGWPGFGSAAMTPNGMDNSAKVLTFTSAPLEEDMEITGPINLKLWISSTETDADIIAKVYEVPQQAAPGPLRPMTRGWLKASHRALDPALSLPGRPFHPHDKRELLEPKKIYPVEVEVWPTSQLLKKGSRIRLDLANADSPVFDMPFNHHYGCKQGTDWYHHDAEHPSQMLLPVVPRG